LKPVTLDLYAVLNSTAYFYSVAVTFGFVEGMPFYWELATLVTVMLLGHWMEMRAVGSAQGALNELAKLLPDTAELVADGRTETVPVSALRAGDLVLVRPGACVPADGTVEEGDSQLNEAMITGGRARSTNALVTRSLLERSTGVAHCGFASPKPVNRPPWLALCDWSLKHKRAEVAPRPLLTVRPTG
jgi:high-affinity K+ transport system ATPase subunit B